MTHQTLPKPDLSQAIDPHPLTVTPDTTVLEAIGLMTFKSTNSNWSNSHSDIILSGQTHCLLVINQDELIGIFTPKDAVKLISTKQPLNKMSIASAMSTPVTTIKKSQFTDIFAAIKLLDQHQISHLPLIDDEGKLSGLITDTGLRQLLQPMDLLKLRLVAEVIATEIVKVPAETSVLEIAELMANYEVHCIIIVKKSELTETNLSAINEADNLGLIPIGIVTEYDVLNAQNLTPDLASLTASQIMSQDLWCISPEDPLLKAHAMMQQYHVPQLVVVDRYGQLVGLLTESNLLQALNPWEMYELLTSLKTQVKQLEAEKIELLETRNQILQAEQKKLQLEINERTLLEQNLHTAQLEMRGFLDAMTDLVLLINCVDRTIKVAPTNPQYYYQSGVNILDPTIEKILNSEDGSSFFQTMQNVLNTRETASLEYNLTEGENTIFLSAKIAPVSQQVVVFMIRDITELKQAQIALQEAHNFLEKRVKQRTAELEKVNELLRHEIRDRVLAEIALEQAQQISDTLFNTSKVLTIVLDPQGRIIRCNPACEKITGYNYKEIAGIYFWNCLIFPENRHEVAQNFQELLTKQVSDQEQIYQNNWLSKDGTIHLIRWSNSIVTNHKGQVEYVITTGIVI